MANKRSKTSKARKTISSKIARGIRRYWRRVHAIQREYGLRDIRSARARYRTDVLMASRRFERIAIDRVQDRPRYISKSMITKYGKVLTRGKDKGRIVLYYDTATKRAVTARRAFRMRLENTVSRLAIRAQLLTKTQQSFFAKKYWPRYAKRRGYLTEFEARRMIRKLLRLRRYDPKVRIGMRNIYGYG